jgi:hypothetical protein
MVGDSIKVCDWCGLEFRPRHGNQKYCGDECARNGERENIQRRVWEYRRKYPEKNNPPLPFGGLGPHPKDNENDEFKAIQREKKRLGLL